MHRIAALTTWVSIAFALILAFFVFTTVDEAQPAGTRTAFDIVSVGSSSKEIALGTITSAAADLGHNIFKEQPDPRNSKQGRLLYAFIGDRTAFDASGGYTYPTFSQFALSTRVVDASSITTDDVRGRYVTNADPTQLSALLTVLNEAGITATDATIGGTELVGFSIGRGNLAAPSIIIIIALALAISHSVAGHRKIHALKTLHGYHRLRIIGTEIWAATIVVAIGLAGLIVIGTPTIGVLTQFHQALRFLQTLMPILAALYAIVVILIALAVILSPRATISAILKGERASLRDGVLAATAQVTILAIMVATTSAAMNRIEAIEESLARSSQWATGSDLYALRLSEASTHEDMVRDAPQLAAAITALDRTGHVLLVGYKGSIAGDGSAQPTDPEGSRSMLVNNEYLRRQAVYNAQGDRITNLPGGKDTFTLLIPANYAGDPVELLQKYTEYFRDFECLVGRPEGTFSCDPTGTIMFTRPGQDFFTYNGTTFRRVETQEQLSLRDPAVAVVTSESALISPIEYMSYASLDDILFDNPDALDDALREHEVRGAFQGIDNAADSISTSIALGHQMLRMDAISIILGWSVLILSSIVIVAVYCDRRRRPMFIEFIHGYSFTMRHRHYFLTTAGISILGIGLAATLAGSIQSGRELGVAASFIVAQFAIALITIKVYEARFRADLIKRY